MTTSFLPIYFTILFGGSTVVMSHETQFVYRNVEETGRRRDQERACRLKGCKRMFKLEDPRRRLWSG
jgi:hypothetical protein